MKTIVGIACKLSAAFVLSLVAAGGVNAFELRGFRGVSWGEGVEALGASTVAQTVGQVTCYQREHENMLYGNTPLNGVRYCFHKDRLFMVALDAPVTPKAFVAEFQRIYGRPDSLRGEAASWGTKVSGTRAELASVGHEVTRLTIYSKKIEAGVAQRMQQLTPAELPGSLAVSH